MAGPAPQCARPRGLRRRARAAGLAAALAAGLAGCSGAPFPQTPPPAEGPWPALVDAPFAPAADEIDPTAPDPAEGARIAEALQGEAARAANRAAATAGPVLSAADAARLGAAARR